MKAHNLILAATSICLFSCSPQVYVNNPQPRPVQQPVPRPPDNSYQVFYDALSPYGRWINYPGEGYVWVPNVGPDFRPYATNGHWVATDQGWAWASNYEWGWAPFHYGRWFFEDNYGWMWLPGHEWAPAWVTWGRSGDYYGWAPIPPHINIAADSWTPPDNSWSFVPVQHITRVNVVNYVVNNKTTVVNNTTVVKNVTIINNITNNKVVNNSVVDNNVSNTNNIVNNTYKNVVYNKGPEVKEVENVTNTRIQKVTINEKAEPGAAILNANQLTVYRPVIRANIKNGQKMPAPKRAENYRQPNH